jgi:chromosomal replication initiation ATPase DnaA
MPSATCHLPSPAADETAELAIVREAIVTGRITPLAEQLCRKYYTQPAVDWQSIANAARDLVCSRTGVTRAEMDSRDRHEHVAYARFYAQHLLSVFTPFSSGQIAKVFGRDHVSVLHGRQAVKNRMKQFRSIRHLVQDLEREFASITGLKRNPS